MKIGIDVGGTNLVAGAVDKMGEVCLKVRCKTGAEEGYEAVLTRLVGLVEELVEKMAAAGLEKPEVIGAGVPGIVSADGALVLSCPNLFWRNETLKADLEEKTGLPVYLSNDATVAGIAENRFGSTKGHKNAVMFTIGTGVGGSVIIDGRAINGRHGVASEFGHTLVGEGLYVCNCGKKGCLETYSSATALIRRAQMLIESGETTAILEMARGRVEDINAQMVIDAAREGDVVGKICFDAMVTHLAIAISNIIDLLDPDIFTIGGGVAGAGDFLLDALKIAVDERITFKEVVKPKIVLATLKNDAGIVGAAYIREYCA